MEENNVKAKSFTNNKYNNTDKFNLLNNKDSKPSIITEEQINLLNKDVNFYLMTREMIEESEMFQINANVLNNPRFSKIFEQVDFLNYKYLLAYLSLSADEGRVVKGLNETMRAIEQRKVKLVFIAADCLIEDYSKLIQKLCELNDIQYIIVPKWTHLRDILFKNLPTSAEIIEMADKKAKPVNIRPKCNAAAIFSDIEFKLSFNNSSKNL